MYMVRTKKPDTTSKKKPIRLASTEKGREKQLISMAEEEAARRIKEGTASPQIIVHYLKLGSIKEGIEKDILVEQKKLVKAKTDSLRSQKRVEELYEDA